MVQLPKTLLMGVLTCLLAIQFSAEDTWSQALAKDPLHEWRKSSPGMSSNAALAFYRLRNSNSTTGLPRTSGYQAGVPYSRYLGPAPGTRRMPAPSLQSYYQSAVQRPVEKPFASVRPAPTAFERYWPLMLEARQDPETGLVIWSFP